MTLTLEFDVVFKNLNIGHISWKVSYRTFIGDFLEFDEWYVIELSYFTYIWVPCDTFLFAP
jgi:hypothetical protein